MMSETQKLCDLTAPGQEVATFLWAGICHEVIVDVGSHSQVTD